MDQRQAFKDKAVKTLASLARGIGYMVACWAVSKLHVPAFAQQFVSDQVAQGVLMAGTTAALAGVCWLKNAAQHNEKIALVTTAIKLPSDATIDEVFDAAKTQALAKDVATTARE